MAKSIPKMNATFSATPNTGYSAGDLKHALKRLVSRGYVKDNGGAYRITAKGLAMFEKSDRIVSFIQRGGDASFEAIQAAFPDIETECIQTFLEDFLFEGDQQ